MKRLLAVCAVLLTAGCCIYSEVKAIQPATTPLATCAHFANSRYRANNPDGFEKITLFPQQVVVENLNGKMGSQYISKVLSGNGVLQLKKRAPLPIHFTCLLENDHKTVFFHANPRQMVSVSEESKHICGQGGDASQMVQCLEKVLKQEEQKLTQIEKKIGGRGNKHAQELLGLSGQEWQRYRDAECIRRRAFREEESPATEYECRIYKTQERIKDLSFAN